MEPQETNTNPNETSTPSEPVISDEELKKPDDAVNPIASPESHSHVVAILGIVVVVLILVLAGLYLWGTTVSAPATTPAPAATESTTTPPTDTQAPVDSQVQALQTVSSSDSIDAIQADLNNTNLDSLDAGVNTVNSDLSATASASTTP